MRLLGSVAVELPCVVEIENTPQRLCAHAVIDDAAIGPGDAVLLHDAPPAFEPGECVHVPCSATIYRAGAARRWWTRLTAPLAFLDLYEVGFQPKEL